MSIPNIEYEIKLFVNPLCRAVQTAGYLGGQEIAFLLLPHTPLAHLNQPFEGRTALCWAVLRGDQEMVEAILERRPSLQGLRTVQSKTTLEVGELSFLQRKQVFISLPKVSALLVKYITVAPSLQQLARNMVSHNNQMMY